MFLRDEHTAALRAWLTTEDDTTRERLDHARYFVQKFKEDHDV